MDPVGGWFRLLLTVALLVLGAMMRLGRFPQGAGLRIGIPWADADGYIRRRWRRRVGEMVLLWAGWVAIQMLVGMPESWMTALWVPLVIVTALALIYPARLYAHRHLFHTEDEGTEGRVIPRGGGWPVILLRETVPLAAVLIPILVVKGIRAELPAEIPVSWTLSEGPFLWMARDEALKVLRHQTSLVYLLLAGLEGFYLVVRWARGGRGDIALRMLTRRHWLYFLFRVGWVLFFAGLNLGFAYHALDGRSLVPYLAPGLAVLALPALLAVRRPIGPPPPRS